MGQDVIHQLTEIWCTIFSVVISFLPLHGSFEFYHDQCKCLAPSTFLFPWIWQHESTIVSIGYHGYWRKQKKEAGLDRYNSHVYSPKKEFPTSRDVHEGPWNWTHATHGANTALHSANTFTSHLNKNPETIPLCSLMQDFLFLPQGFYFVGAHGVFVKRWYNLLNNRTGARAVQYTMRACMSVFCTLWFIKNKEMRR